ncbi:ethanolamine ammonia-lyase reactivating factor EutA [Patescibacteria group bacterium]|nr:ethanolamine ammonia-lyase reactivating factor EutA [Patescibacteria group bacterium]
MNILARIIKKKENKDNCFISLDIGSETIKALAFHLDRKEDKVYILGFGEVKQKIGNMEGDDIQNISGVIASCKKAIETATAMTDIQPKKVVIGINGGFVMGKAIKLEYQRKDFKLKINLDEIRSMVNKIQKDVHEKIQNKLSLDPQEKEKIEITNASVVDIAIDGYRVISPIGFKGREIEFNVFSSFLYVNKLDILKKIAKGLQLDLFDIVASPYAVAMSIGAEDDMKFNAILIDIGGKTTNVSIVNNGNIAGTSTFNIGGRAFTKSLSDELKISMNEAEDLKLKYSSNKLDKEKEKKIKEIFAYDCEILFAGVEITLKEFSDTNLLPTQIILYGGGSQLAHIGKIISKLFLKKSLPFPAETKIKFVNTEDIVNVIDKTNKIQGCQHINSMSLANFVLKLEESDDGVNIILRDLIKKSY